MRTFAPLLALLILPACSPGAALPSPQLGFAVDAPPVMCRVAGAPILVDTDVNGSTVRVVDGPAGGLHVVVVDPVDSCLHFAVDARGEPDGTDLGSCPGPAPERVAALDGQGTFLVRSSPDDEGVPRLSFGTVTYDFPHVASGIAHPGKEQIEWHPLPVPGPGARGERSPALAAMGSSGLFVAWAQGGHIRGMTLSRDGAPASELVDFAVPGATRVGPPAVAFHAGSARGIVAFTATTGSGTDVYAIPVSCGR